MTGPGRPTRFSQPLADAICEKLAEGASLRSICEAEGYPAESTVRLWVVDDREGFAAQYARSRDIGLDCRADAAVDAAKRAKDAGLGRLAFDADRWYLSQLAPKKWAPNQKVELSGHLSMSEMTEDQIREELAQLAGAGVIPLTLADQSEPDDGSDLV